MIVSLSTDILYNLSHQKHEVKFGRIFIALGHFVDLHIRRSDIRLCKLDIFEDWKEETTAVRTHFSPQGKSASHVIINLRLTFRQRCPFALPFVRSVTLRIATF